jgi:hypothetical protein
MISDDDENNDCGDAAHNVQGNEEKKRRGK